MSSTIAFQFNGKIALVTGAGQGIGRATCLALSAAGATVYALSKSQQNLDSLVAECPGIRPVCVDLNDWHKTQFAVKSLGPIDLLVNNAGVAVNKTIVETTVEEFDLKNYNAVDLAAGDADVARVMNVNVRAIYAVSQVVVRGLLERGAPGAIVNVSSKAGSVSLPLLSAYCASKGAVDQLTRSMAYELGPHNIRVNSVNPTVVMTAMGRQLWSDPALADPVRSRIPLRKFAEEIDVVNAILYLLSDSAAMTNGIKLPIDGGYLAS